MRKIREYQTPRRSRRCWLRTTRHRTRWRRALSRNLSQPESRRLDRLILTQGGRLTRAVFVNELSRDSYSAVYLRDFAQRLERGLESFQRTRQRHVAGEQPQSYEVLSDDASTHDEKQHHRLGEGNSAISHGRWQAWRLWVNKGNPGYRLHYWRDDDAFIFMHVRFHDDYSIDAPGK